MRIFENRWFCRFWVLLLASGAMFLLSGPSLESLRTLLSLPVLMAGRVYQRNSAFLARARPGMLMTSGWQPASKGTYAWAASLFCGLSILPLWFFCDRALIAITLVPALILTWFAIWTYRGT